MMVYCRTREPRVLAFAGLCGVLAGHHLTVDVGFNLMQCLVLDECRTDFDIVFPRVIASAYHRLANDNPWVVVAEDAGVLFVACGIT